MRSERENAISKRVLGGAAAIAVAGLVVAVALVVGGGGGGGPRALPVLGAATGGAASVADEAARLSSASGMFGGGGYDFTGDADGLATDADAWSVDREDGGARARALAKAFGLGELADNGEQWTAEGPDGFLTVDRQPGLPWYYSVTLVDGGIATTPVPGDTPVSSDGSSSDGSVSSDGYPGSSDGYPWPATGDDTSGISSTTSVGSATSPDCDEAAGCATSTTDLPCQTGEECAISEPGSSGPGSAGAGAPGTGGGSGVACAPLAPAPGQSDSEPAAGTLCAVPSIDCAMPECPPDAACIQVCPEPGPDGEPIPMPEPERPADLPSAKEAEAIARDLLGSVGADLTGAETRVDDGFSTWAFVADPVVGGLPTFGMTSIVGVGSAGRIEYANGWLDDPTEGDTYPLVGVDAALERLDEMGGGWFAYAPGAPEPAVDCLGCDELPAPEPTVLDTVRVGLQLVPAYGLDEAWLVPSYLFTIEGGGPGAVVAAFAIADDLLAPPVVAEETLVDPVPSEPEPAPAPEPGSVGGAPGDPDGLVALESGQRAEVGVTYYLELYTHCGITGMVFDGRLWDADPPLDDGNGNPPPGWENGMEGGGITLLSPDEAEFVGDTERTKVARFVPRPADAGDPPGCD